MRKKAVLMDHATIGCFYAHISKKLLTVKSSLGIASLFAIISVPVFFFELVKHKHIACFQFISKLNFPYKITTFSFPLNTL